MKISSILLLIWLLSCNVDVSGQDSARIAERIEVIQKMLDHSVIQTDVWWYGWLGTYSAATVGQGAFAVFSDDLTTRQDMALGAGTTVLGAAFQLLAPLNVRKYAHELSKMPESSDEEKYLKLKVAESYLSEIASIEKAGRSWQIHAINSAVNATSGLITWLGFKRSVWDGVTNFLLNSAITELQIWTQPTRLIRDHQRYQLQYLQNKPAEYKTNPAELYFKTYPAGVLVGVRF